MTAYFQRSYSNHPFLRRKLAVSFREGNLYGYVLPMVVKGGKPYTSFEVEFWGPFK